MNTFIAWHQVAGWAEKSNATIAREVGTTSKYVGTYRSRHKLPQGPRSPGSGLSQRPAALRPLSNKAKAQRLDAVWAFLWPDDPTNTRRRDEVEAIKQRSCCAQLP